MTDPVLEEKDKETMASGPAAAGVGATLRSLREARRISISEASQRLKYSVRQITELEDENWEKLPGGVALRGFVRNYARYLDADVDSVLALLDNQIGPTAPSSVMAVPAGPARVQGEAALPVAHEGSHRPWGWFFIILAILLIAAFYAVDRGWVPESWLVFDWLKAIANNE